MDDSPEVFVLIRGVLQRLGGTAVRGQHLPRYVIIYMLYLKGGLERHPQIYLRFCAITAPRPQLITRACIAEASKPLVGEPLAVHAAPSTLFNAVEGTAFRLATLARGAPVRFIKSSQTAHKRAHLPHFR
jgi:hypothetical protein